MPRKPTRPRFRRPAFPRSAKPAKLFSWWLLWRVPVLAMVVMGLWWFIVEPFTREQGWTEMDTSFALCGERARQQGCVVDGDTVHIGFGDDRRRIRLTGFDAPEINGACEAENRQARAARARLHQWLNQGPFEWDGADTAPRDQYGRELREARRLAPDGSEEKLADIMILNGLASPNGWGEAAINWCAP